VRQSNWPQIPIVVAPVVGCRGGWGAELNQQLALGVRPFGWVVGTGAYENIVVEGYEADDV
jgi:hypothetical protein